MNQNTSSKDFWKPSVLVWHGLNTNVSQIKKKKVGAWPLCFFLIVAYMIYVFHFSFDISLRKKIFFLWCHTNTHGIDLRRTPPWYFYYFSKSTWVWILFWKWFEIQMFGLFDFLTRPASWPQPSWESIPDSETAEKLDWRSGGHILSRLFLVLSTKSCRCSFVKGLPSITKRKQEYCQFPWLKKKRNQNYLIWCYITPVYTNPEH